VPSACCRNAFKYPKKAWSQASLEHVTAGIPFVAFIFGVEQITRPWPAGLLPENTGSLAGSFYITFCPAITAVICSAFLPQKKVNNHEVNLEEENVFRSKNSFTSWC
jgi:hypothetical protein